MKILSLTVILFTIQLVSGFICNFCNQTGNLTNMAQTIECIIDALDMKDLICNRRIAEDRRNHRCQRPNDRDPSDAMYLHLLFPNSTSRPN